MSDSSSGAVAVENAARNGVNAEQSTSRSSPEKSQPGSTALEPSEQRREVTHRAEEMVDRFAVQVGVVTSHVGKGLVRFLARVCEEMTDIWAEAQSRRRGDKS
jgi:hypothetical protein